MQLFICYTPLQVLSAKEIIVSEKIENYYFIYLYNNESKKNDHYYKLLEKKAIFSIKLMRTQNAIIDFFSIYKLSKFLKDNCNNTTVNIYSGNIKSVHTRFLMFLLNYTYLYTFDDGCGNISNTGYYADSNENNLYKLFFQLFEPSLIYKNLRKKMNIHYTIFKEKNIYPNCKYVSLYNTMVQEKNATKPKKIILLTSVLTEDKIINEQREVELYEKIISNFNVTDIIPHPREKKQKININDINIINSHLISEDLLLQMSKDYDLTTIGIFSATLLNISGLNIVNRLISVNFEKSHVNSETERLFMKRGIECFVYQNKNFTRRQL